MNDPKETTNPSQPSSQLKEFSVGNIALSLSGGGYRAAAFHLGVLDFLNQVGLLNQVTMLSTVSGGSITGAKYMQALSQDPKKENTDFFNHFYDLLHEFLKEPNLPDKWLDRLQEQKKKTSSRQPPSLIIAAAKVYASEDGLLSNTCLGDIKNVQDNCHIKDVTFNTTELHTGSAFRFRVGNLLDLENDEYQKVGNKDIPVPLEVIDEILLADIVAASSCFPGGFEPILFPDNFQWSNENRGKKVKEKVKSKLKCKKGQTELNTIPLIDGGICDNLGVDALLLVDKMLHQKYKESEKNLNLNNLAFKQSLEQKRIGTLILSDTDNIGIDDRGYRKLLYDIPKTVDSYHLKINLRLVSRIVGNLFLAFVIATFLGVLGVIYTFFLKNAALGIIYLLIELLLIIVTYLLKILVDYIKSLTEKSQPISNSQRIGEKPLGFQSLRTVIKDWNNFIKVMGSLNIADIINLLNSRLSSLNPLFLAFLKNQRSRSYNSVYETKMYRDKAISCFIHDIQNKLQKHTSYSGEAFFPKELSFISNIDSLQLMADCANKATLTPTTLWFDKDRSEDQLDTLIACGQFTMCFNLLEYCNRRRKNGVSFSSETQVIYKIALEEWQKFEKDPKIWVGKSRLTQVKKGANCVAVLPIDSNPPA